MQTIPKQALLYDRRLQSNSLCFCCCFLQSGRAKKKAAEAAKEKKKNVDRFVSFVRSAEGLYSSTTWDEFQEAFEKEEEFVAVRLACCPSVHCCKWCNTQ